MVETAILLNIPRRKSHDAPLPLWRRQKGEAWKKRYVQSVAESIWLKENGRNIVAQDVRKKETGSGIGKGDKQDRCKGKLLKRQQSRQRSQRGHRGC